MVDWFNTNGELDTRKYQLFQLACCRRIWSLLKDERRRKLVEITEAHIEGLTNFSEVAVAAQEHDAAQQCYDIKAPFFAVCSASVPGFTPRWSAADEAADALAYSQCADSDDDEFIGRIHS